MEITLLVAIFILVISILVAFKLTRGRNFGLQGQIVYTDTKTQEGQTLYSKTVPLMGRPDYLIKKSGTIIPVEVKSSSAPTKPYKNHLVQLTAYCLLVEENYGVKVPFGLIQYSNGKFEVEYTKENKDFLLSTIAEIKRYKSGEPFKSDINRLCAKCKRDY
jgi:CRISPR-associated exonuclease Cas4